MPEPMPAPMPAPGPAAGGMSGRTLPEALCFWALVLTWPFYFIGGLYVVGPVLVWTLGLLAGLSLYLGPAIGPGLRATGPVPVICLVWIAGMLVLLLALWIAYVPWDLGLGPAIKSTVGWAKGWAMIPLVILAGAVLPVGRAPLVRGQCITGLVTLCLLPILLVARSVGLPDKVFTSPLQVIGGPGPEYFSVYLYIIDPEFGTTRWQFYAPWAPFAGLIGTVMILFALEERVRLFRLAGLAAGLAMILLSASRMSLVALVICTLVPRMMPLLAGSVIWRLAAVAAASMAVIGDYVLGLVNDSIRSFREARASSSRVRATLQEIAWQRWQSEAIWFGHGEVERGPHIVEYMPIGSHHTWYGLLFVKGVVGFLGLAIPLVWHFAITAVDAVRGPRGRLPFGILLQIVILTFGENLEIEVYMFWPALLLLGIHLREMARAGI